MRSPLLPTGWVVSQGVNVTGAPFWVTSAVTPHTAPNDAFSTAPGNILDNRLDTPLFSADPFALAITFLNSYNLQSGRDGAVLEISSPNINGGAFTDITDPAVGGSVSPGYNSVISSAFQSPIAGRMAWSGNSGGYVLTQVSYTNASFPPSQIKLRFRLVTDNSGASEGWRIDTLTFLSNECPSPAPTPTATPTATATATPISSPCGSNVMADSTFEAGRPWSNWTVQTSTNFGTPLCDVATCGTVSGSPYAGDNWAWFGGANVPETATLGQSVPFMTGGTAKLNFVMWKRDTSQPNTDVLNVRVDGTIVQSYPEAGPVEFGYSLRTIDLSAFADGGSHLILFEYIGPSTSVGSYLVDNVILTNGAACPTPSPTPPPTPSPTTTPSATPTATVPPTVTPTPSDCPGGGCSPSPSIPPPATATPSPTLTAPPTPPPTPTPSPTATPSPAPAQALNISTRLRVEAGDRVAIGGFIITGTESKRVALRGIGPSLASSGLSDVLADPTLELRGPDGALLLQNDNWQDDPFGGGGAELGALGLALQNPNESGMVATLPPGAYTAIMAGKNQTSGLGLVEIYDVDTAADSQLANISTRGFVRTADNVMIGGFILGNGSGSVDVVVRGLGPSLDRFMLLDVLLDPTLELHDGNGALLVANDDWQDDPVSAAQLNAYGLEPPNAVESGIFITLPPGLFTAILAGKNGGVGLGLVEVYSGVHGNTLTVTNTADSGAGSLRRAILDANSGDTIQFDRALDGQTIYLTSGELLINKHITISGPGPNLLAVSRAGGNFRIFHITTGRTVTIEGLKIFGGNTNEPGGGILNEEATLTLNNCVVVNNFSAYGGGGIYSDGGTANLTIFNCTIANNRAGLVGGSPGGAFGGGIYNNNGTLEISDSTISGNFANERCGGVYNSVSGTLSIRDSVVDGNTVMFQPPFVERAGGIFNAGTAEITNCTISHNAGVGHGGGIDNQGSLTITNSTLNNNTVVDSGGGISNSGPLTITNSTISGNSASFKGFGNGGGIYNGNATLTITNSTISGNSAGSFDGFGGGIYLSVGTLQIGNTILVLGAYGANISGNPGTVTSHGYNLSSDNGGGFLTATGDQINTSPMLGPLQDNGGPTFTHELLTGSSAINAGDPTFTPPPLYDQRGPGYDRVVGGRIDIGSFEVQPVGSAPRVRH